MKYESIILQALFAACLLVCVLTFGAMVTFHAPVPSVASAVVAAAVGHAG